MPITTLDERAALVVVDLQAGILGMATVPLDPAQVLASTVALADAFRGRGLPVVLVRVTHARDGSDATPGRTDLTRSLDRPDGWDELTPELGPRPGDLVVTKRNWSAFYGTDLDLLLRRRGITQIALTGIATSLGVESTARAAHEHGYHVVLVTDAMADGAAEAHENSITRIFPRLGQTTTTQDLLTLVDARPGQP